MRDREICESVKRIYGLILNMGEVVDGFFID